MYERLGNKMKKIEDYVRSIPDFPEEGIIFRDVTSVLQDADGLQLAIDSMQDLIKKVWNVDICQCPVCGNSTMVYLGRSYKS